MMLLGIKQVMPEGNKAELYKFFDGIVQDGRYHKLFSSQKRKCRRVEYLYFKSRGGGERELSLHGCDRICYGILSLKAHEMGIMYRFSNTDLPFTEFTVHYNNQSGKLSNVLIDTDLRNPSISWLSDE